MGLVRRRTIPDATRRAAEALKWAITVFFLVLGLATLAAYIKIGIEHATATASATCRPGCSRRPPNESATMKIVYTDVLVIGGGLAGLRVAIGARRRGHDVIILSLVPPKRSHSAAAQGGMQASLANVIKGQGDNEDVHFEDTVRGSDWGADQRVVRMFVNTAPKAVRELAAWGVPWSRVRRATGRSSSTARRSRSPSATRRTACSRSATSAAPRSGAPATSRTAPVTRCCIAMSDQAIAESIPVHERTEAIALIHDGGRCYGAIVRDLITGELRPTSPRPRRSRAAAPGGFIA